MEVVTYPTAISSSNLIWPIPLEVVNRDRPQVHQQWTTLVSCKMNLFMESHREARLPSLWILVSLLIRAAPWVATPHNSSWQKTINKSPLWTRRSTKNGRDRCRTLNKTYFSSIWRKISSRTSSIRSRRIRRRSPKNVGGRNSSVNCRSWTRTLPPLRPSCVSMMLYDDRVSL